jgi:alkylated DNA repair protein (DNA oxidative demethylase)
MRSETLALFEPAERETIAPGAVLLRGRLRAQAHDVLTSIVSVLADAPLRHMQTPGGYCMSVAMSNCGALGWVSDARGYRYTPTDPLSGRAWPALPGLLRQLAVEAAAEAGFDGFAPDACLINRYAPGTRLTLHQDRNERDLVHPIVSVSLGLPAVFLFGGPRRADRARRVPLAHGDVVVWGGTSRLHYHGVLPVAGDAAQALAAPDAALALIAGHRINLTLRRAG